MPFSSTKKCVFYLKGHFLLRKKGTFHLEKGEFFGYWKKHWGPPPPVPPPLVTVIENGHTVKPRLEAHMDMILLKVY